MQDFQIVHFEIAINPKAHFGYGPSKMKYENTLLLALLPLLVMHIIPKLPLALF